MKELNIELLEIKKWQFFAVICAFQIAILFIIDYFLNTKQLFYNTYAGQIAYDRIEKSMQNQQKYKWVGYALVPILLYIKILYNTAAIMCATILSTNKISFNDHYNVCLKAEFVFVAMLIVKFACLVLFMEIETLQDLGFMPGSLANLYDLDNVPKWLIYPLQTVNIWEVLFCWVGTMLYTVHFDVDKTTAFKRFCLPYLTGLFVWVLVVVFITLMAS